MKKQDIWLLLISIAILTLLFALTSCKTTELTSVYNKQMIDESWLKIDHSEVPFAELRVNKIIKRLNKPTGCDTSIFRDCFVISWGEFNGVTKSKIKCKKITYIPITYDDVNKTYYIFGIKKWEKMILTNEERKNIVPYIK